jgi:peptide/nickel transport system permease protein
VSGRPLYRTAAYAALVLVAVALVAQFTLGRDPNAQPDGLVLRNLPPLSRATTLLLADGDRIYCHEVEEITRSELQFRRGNTWKQVSVADLQGGSLSSGVRSELFLLGTDSYGRDMAARLVHGGKISLLIGLLAAAMAVVIGSAIGLAAGFAGGPLDSILMRCTDLALSIPRLYLALLLVALFGPSLLNTVLILGATSWMTSARLVRGQVLALKRNDWVTSARAAGAGPLRQAVLHVFPGAAAPVMVEAALRTGDSILLETSLSFLGLGVLPPAASWGSLIADGRDRLLDAWWIATFPGLAVAVTVLVINRMGDRTAPDRQLEAASEAVGPGRPSMPAESPSLP